MELSQASRGLVGGTLGTDVVHRLRDDIISCRIPPGERLPYEKLRKIYGVSFGTLREALCSLASERLVVAEGQRGFQVAPVTRQDLLELTDLRVMVEKEAIRLSIAYGDEEWESGLLASFHRLARCQQRLGAKFAQFPEWVERHQEFHKSLTSACKSNMLSELRDVLFDRAHRYRCISSARRSEPLLKKAEHRHLMEAVLARDEVVSLNLIESHIRETAHHILEKAADLLEG